jgi:hypothetical protein
MLFTTKIGVVKLTVPVQLSAGAAGAGAADWAVSHAADDAA